MLVDGELDQRSRIQKGKSMTEATKNNGKQWFDPRITISGMIQIILLVYALFKFGAEIDKRTSLLEQTVTLHTVMIKNNNDIIAQLADSNRRIVTIIEQYQRGNK